MQEVLAILFVFTVIIRHGIFMSFCSAKYDVFMSFFGVKYVILKFR